MRMILLSQEALNERTFLFQEVHIYGCFLSLEVRACRCFVFRSSYEWMVLFRRVHANDSCVS